MLLASLDIGSPYRTSRKGSLFFLLASPRVEPRFCEGIAVPFCVRNLRAALQTKQGVTDLDLPPLVGFDVESIHVLISRSRLMVFSVLA